MTHPECSHSGSSGAPPKQPQSCACPGFPQLLASSQFCDVAVPIAGHVGPLAGVGRVGGVPARHGKDERCQAGPQLSTQRTQHIICGVGCRERMGSLSFAALCPFASLCLTERRERSWVSSGLRKSAGQTRPHKCSLSPHAAATARPPHAFQDNQPSLRSAAAGAGLAISSRASRVAAQAAATRTTQPPPLPKALLRRAMLLLFCRCCLFSVAVIQAGSLASPGMAVRPGCVRVGERVYSPSGDRCTRAAAGGHKCTAFRRPPPDASPRPCAGCVPCAVPFAGARGKGCAAGAGASAERVRVVGVCGRAPDNRR